MFKDYILIGITIASLGITVLAVNKVYTVSKTAAEYAQAFDSVRNNFEAFMRTQGRAIDSAYICKTK